MKRTWMRLVVALVMAVSVAEAADFWIEDFDVAARKAQDEGRYLLVNFTGSDWCGWCIRLDKEVFSTPEFETYVDENLVCAFVDFPRRKEVPPERQERNAALASQYEVPGYPTILILAPDGSLVERTGYRPGGAEAYIEHLKQIISTHEHQGAAKTDAP